MSFVEDMAQVPARFSVINLATNEEVVAQLNPTEFDDEVGAEWNRLTTPGAWHERMHFGHTSNYVVPMDLYFAALTEVDYVRITRARNHIKSWCYPQAASADSLGKGPPRLLATWPVVFSIECYLIRCKIKYQRFAPDGRCTRFVASVQFEDCSETRQTSEHVAAATVVRGESAEASSLAANETVRRWTDWNL